MKDPVRNGSIAEAAVPEKQLPPIVRPLGKMERSAWIFDQASPFNLGSAVTLHGEVTEAGLREALRWCQNRYPLLRSIIRRDRMAPCFACYEPAEAPEIPLEVCTGSEEDQDRIATEELRRAFDNERELMVRVKLVKFSSEHCAIFITFQHFMGDGWSAANLLVDIVNLLGTLSSGGTLPPVEALPFPPTLEEGVAPKFKGFQGMMKMVGCQGKVNQRMKQLGDMPVPLRHQADVPFAERLPAVESISFDASETAALAAYARKENTSFYALLTGIMLDTIYPYLSESKNRKKKGSAERVIVMPVPVNIRPYLSVPVKSDFGFFASTADVVCKLTGEEDIAQMAREIRAEVKAAMARDSARMYVMPMVTRIMDWKPFFPNGSKGVARAAKFISHMAQYSATSLTFLNFQKLLTQAGNLAVSNPRGYVAPSMLGTALFSAVLFDGKLNLHVTHNDKQISREDAAQLMSRYRQTALNVACAVPAVAE